MDICARFTYIDDIVEVLRCCDKPAANPDFDHCNPILQRLYPHLLFNIGNSQPTQLLRCIELMEKTLGRQAIKDFQPMQPGDVEATAADTTALEEWIGFRPSTQIEVGIEYFVNWYKSFYRF